MDDLEIAKVSLFQSDFADSTKAIGQQVAAAAERAVCGHCSWGGCATTVCRQVTTIDAKIQYVHVAKNCRHLLLKRTTDVCFRGYYETRIIMFGNAWTHGSASSIYIPFYCRLLLLINNFIAPFSIKSPTMASR